MCGVQDTCTGGTSSGISSLSLAIFDPMTPDPVTPGDGMRLRSRGHGVVGAELVASGCGHCGYYGKVGAGNRVYRIRSESHILSRLNFYPDLCPAPTKNRTSQASRTKIVTKLVFAVSRAPYVGKKKGLCQERYRDKSRLEYY